MSVPNTNRPVMGVISDYITRIANWRGHTMGMPGDRERAWAILPAHDLPMTTHAVAHGVQQIFGVMPVYTNGAYAWVTSR